MLEDAAKRAAAVKVPGGKFTGAGKSKELITLQLDDEFEVPVDSEVVNIPIRGRKNDDGTPATYEAVYGILYRPIAAAPAPAQGGRGRGRAAAATPQYTEMAVAISPGVFSRSFEVVDETTGNAVGRRAQCTGEASDTFYEGLDLDDQMNKIRGTRWKVDLITEEWSYNPQFGDKKPRKQRVYEINKA